MNYKLSAILITIVLIFISCREKPTENNQQIDTNDIVRDIINETNPDSLSHFVRILSGETAVHINDSTFNISSRHKYYPGNNIAADFIQHTLLRYGLNLTNQNFSHTGRNVYGIQTGTIYPDQYYILCAHYDSMPDSSLSPGADDNASGIAAVLEAARILHNYNFKHSVMYALWDEEEQVLTGSSYFANRARYYDDQIAGVINLDMIAWDSNDDGRFWINVRDTAEGTRISQKMIQIHNDHNIGLSPQVLNPGSGSDNVPFWINGFAAIGVEEMYGEDWNEHYHQTSDRIEFFNFIYFYKISQLAIATTASLAGIQFNN